ncbi:MAG: 3-isopropylmalate dehydratase [Methanospirillum sp.]
MRITGRALRLPPDLDTDMIIAGRYLRTKDRSVWATHAFEDLDPSIAGQLAGAVLVAGPNFGCGSSREQAAIALRKAGVVAVVAPSFARIFYRNAINLGLPIAEAALACADGETVEVDLEAGLVRADDRPPVSIAPLSPRMRAILSAGGLVELLKDEA